MSPIRRRLLLLLLCAAASAAAASSAAPTTYEVLQSYNFPVGLLPEGALGYDLEPATGKFAAYLNGSCSFSLEGSYKLRYDSTISGVISRGQLRDLRGVSVKILFLWVNIVEVDRRGDELEFSVGIASADFAIDNFFVSPRCGCGLNCLSLPGGAGRAGSKLRGSF